MDENCDGRDAGLKSMGAEIRHLERGRGRRTQITRLVVIDVPAGATVALRCTGRGCPIRARTRLIRAGAARIRLTRYLSGARLSASASVRVSVTHPRMLGRGLRLGMRAGRPPTVARFRLGPADGR
jgi:hypothetical protein